MSKDQPNVELSTHFEVRWEDRLELVASPEQLDALLDRIASENLGEDAVIVEVWHPKTGDSLSIGLGLQLCALCYVPADLNPPYFSAVRQSGLKEPGFLIFKYLGHETELPMKKGVPIPLAREAVRYFVETGELSPEIEWEED